MLALAWMRAVETAASDEVLAILARSTRASPHIAGDPAGLRFRALGPADAPRYAAVLGTDSVASFRARLSASTRCYAVEDGAQLLHASWVTTGCAWTREVRSWICVGTGAAYVYESFTHPDARGRGVYPFALNEICRELVGRDVERLWVAVERHNPASLRAVAKAGFEEVFEIAYRRRAGRLAVVLPEGVKTDTKGRSSRKKRRIWLPGDGATEQGKP